MGPQEPADGELQSSGGRTRTPNNRARTCRVADYTTPEWAEERLADRLANPNLNGTAQLPLAETQPQAAEVPVADDPPRANCDRLL